MTRERGPTSFHQKGQALLKEDGGYPGYLPWKKFDWPRIVLGDGPEML